MGTELQANDTTCNVLKKIVQRTEIAFSVPSDPSSDPVSNDMFDDLFRKWLQKLNLVP